MTGWGVVLCLAALAGVQVIADELLTFPENVQGPPSNRIVSGWDAVDGQYPWQLSLRMVSRTGGVSSCGGSVISNKWGLTSAHCTANRDTMVLRLGLTYLRRPLYIFETVIYINHPLYIEWLSVVQPNDIALLKFPRAVEYSDRLQPIRLQRSADRNRNYDGVRLIASGWGRTWTNGATPQNLQWVYLLGDTNERCRSAFGGSSIVQDSTICASFYNVTSQSTCQGDSGGPLVDIEEDGKPTLVGVTCFVSALGCHVGFPAGFVRPGHYHEWIADVTGLKDLDWEPKEPTTVAPTTTEPTTVEPTTAEPTTPEPTTAEPTTPKPTTEEPTTAEPTTPKPTTEEPTTTEPTTAEPTTVEPTTAEPTTAEPTTAEPTTAEPTTAKPTTAEPTTAEPTTAEPTTAEPTTAEPTTAEPTTAEPTTAEPTTAEPTTAEPTTAEPTTAEPTTAEPTTAKPTTAEPTTVDPTTAEPTTVDPTTAEPTTVDPTTAEPTTVEPTTKEPTTAEPTTEGPSDSSFFSYFRAFARY